ncbi:sigma factor-like helix-turn-helix DNA-binding protein [Gorillibacterium sp. sgz5001074]|uniref:sigma factor-like helix-turn-helix DNA-binding protein n=1 Tax=Gorillibacterium sp. sgz5001074 TaxID=3446695 RepID=UPI003F67F005
MDFNQDTDYTADITTYRRTRERLCEARGDPKVEAMIRDVDYVIEWLETGRRPGNKRGVERLAAYQRDIPTDLIEKYMLRPQYMPQGRSIYSPDEVVYMEYLLSTLTERECECYVMHIGGLYSMRDIADLLDLTVSTVHETVKRAERKIKISMNRGKPLLLDIVV